MYSTLNKVNPSALCLYYSVDNGRDITSLKREKKAHLKEGDYYFNLYFHVIELDGLIIT